MRGFIFLRRLSGIPGKPRCWMPGKSFDPTQTSSRASVPTSITLYADHVYYDDMARELAKKVFFLPLLKS
jgi:hypothetical protein